MKAAYEAAKRDALVYGAGRFNPRNEIDHALATREMAAALFQNTNGDFADTSIDGTEGGAAPSVFSFGSVMSGGGGGVLHAGTLVGSAGDAATLAADSSQHAAVDKDDDGGDAISVGGVSRVGGGRLGAGSVAGDSEHTVHSTKLAYTRTHATAAPPDAWLPVASVAGARLTAHAHHRLGALAVQLTRHTQHALDELTSENSVALRAKRRAERTTADVDEAAAELRDAELEAMRAQASLPAPAEQIARVFAHQPPGLVNMRPPPPPRGMTL